MEEEPRYYTSAEQMGQSDDEDNQGRRYQCGDFCHFNIFKIPGLLLRNAILPREMWDEFPNGFERIADRFVFQPDNCRDDVPTPTELSIDCDYEEVTILTKDKVKLHSYLIKPASASSKDNMTSTSNGTNLDTNKNETQLATPISSAAPVIIYFHGNSGNIGYCLDVVKTFIENSDMAQCHWLMVEYRGFGKSDGRASEKGVYTDAKAAFNFVESHPDLKSKKIVLLGHSIGGAVAIHLASHRRYRKKVAGLILENTFTSIPQLAKKLMGMAIINFLPTFCYSAKFESICKINKVRCPTLFCIGNEDEIVPNEMTITLYGKCGAAVKVVEQFPDGEHNNTYKCPEFVPIVAAFLKANVITIRSSEPDLSTKTCA